MMTRQAYIPEIERSKFFSGQRLKALDLSELQRANRELRWLHNRSLHAWGIAADFGVTGDRGDTKVDIDPGFAVDCLGREIILTEARTVKVPATAGKPKGEEARYYLVASYQPDENQRVAERRPGVCQPEGTVRLEEEPRIDWKEPKSWQKGVEIILAQAWVKNCQLSRPLSLAVRRDARPSQQPYITAGQTKIPGAEWQAWELDPRKIS